jgi:dTDP-4-dehydrorhamnose 3,5-epimerase
MTVAIFTRAITKTSLKKPALMLILCKTTSRFRARALVRVLQGRVLDVAVDIRKSSPTYGQHVTVELSGDNHKQFWVPAGFLHGFVTLEDNTIFTYKVTNFYDKASEIGVIWNDPSLAIGWGIDDLQVNLSPKDEILPAFADFNSPF